MRLFDQASGTRLAHGFTKHIFCGRDFRPKLPEILARSDQKYLQPPASSRRAHLSTSARKLIDDGRSIHCHAQCRRDAKIDKEHQAPTFAELF